MDVDVRGRLRLALFPGLIVTLEDVHVGNHGMDIASAPEARVAIEILPLLGREVRVEAIAVKSPRISIERDRVGRFNFASPDATASKLPTVDWPAVSLGDATIAYADKQSGDAFQAEGCRLDLHRLRFSGESRSSLLKDISFTAELSCAEVRGDGFIMSDLKSAADAKHGLLDLEPVTMRVFETQGSGSMRVDFSRAVPSFQVRCSLPQFPIEEFFKTVSAKKVAVGRMDFSASLAMQGTSAKDLRQSMSARVSLRGKNVTLLGGDLDGQLSRFESSQNFNLVDVGAFFFVGPLGVAVTKGYDFAQIFRETGTSSEIRTLVSDWTVERGVAHAQDVAMAKGEPHRTPRRARFRQRAVR